MYERHVEETPVCKCCGNETVVYGVVDFNKSCEIIKGRVLPPSGNPVRYHRCPACKFIFTTAFDQFTKEDFSTYIYNDDYATVDPDFVAARPRYNAEVINNLFADCKEISLLDYGGGNGLLETLLRQRGFTNVATYDPFLSPHETKFDTAYDCVVSFEVFEHSIHPYQTVHEISRLLKPNGIVIFSTLLQPDDIDQAGVGWWYIAPRNGHASIHSRESLQILIKKFGFYLAHYDSSLHLLYRNVPDFARHFIRII
jgi:2-polyprenyl-6-hydroxyphenyl methylase/3-demethylubiquinone-9 3-methyltransferase